MNAQATVSEEKPVVLAIVDAPEAVRIINLKLKMSMRTFNRRCSTGLFTVRYATESKGDRNGRRLFFRDELELYAKTASVGEVRSLRVKKGRLIEKASKR